LIFPALPGLLAGEVSCWTITGWDLLLPLFGWWLCFALLLGAVVAAMACRLLGRKVLKR
jgi:uncharacterized membrane protein YccF (DUF307 family)